MNNRGNRRPTALITGASAGIGAAFARVFAEHDFDLALTARRADRLESIAREVRGRWGVNVHVVPGDLTDPAAPERLSDELGAAGIAIDALVNNAGYGLSGTYLDRTWREHDEFIRVMVTAVAELTHRFLGGMVERGYGRIINVASLAGLIPAPAGETLYGASKAFLIKFSESLALEVGPRGVHVTALCPGFTYSEFHEVSGTRDLVDHLPRWMWLDAETVARQGFDAVMAGRPVHVTGRANRAIALLVKHLPTSVVLLAMRQPGGKFRRT
jgi:short-subunit dehydrogenase